MLAVYAQQYTRRAFRRQIGADFPETAAHRPAQRHSDWPAPLRPQKVFPYGVTFGFRQFLQPLPHGLSPFSGSEKDQRDFQWRWVCRHSLLFLYLLSYMYHKLCIPGNIPAPRTPDRNCITAMCSVSPCAAWPPSSSPPVPPKWWPTSFAKPAATTTHPSRSERPPRRPPPVPQTPRPPRGR